MPATRSEERQREELRMRKLSRKDIPIIAQRFMVEE
jgi:hypothetical protein